MNLPDRMKKLARDHRGFVVPWFVQWMDESDKPMEYGQGRPDFRVMDRSKWTRAINEKRCWVCGDPLGRYLAFVIGPMCAVNRTTSEPPAHRECALYSVATCPFMLRPRMRRNEKDIPEHVPIAGFHIDHNPGAMCLWTTRGYKVFKTNEGGAGYLIRIGEPERVEWFAEGRAATLAEVTASIDKGLPHLRKLAEEQGPAAIADMEKQVARVRPYLPAAVPA